MKWITGFFMSWGMFLAIPCPVKRWDEDCRAHMLAMLPLTGLIVGGVWALCSLLWDILPPALLALLLAAVPWLCTGLIHLDGYMDVCDAVLSRRDLPQRQKILKDPHCGAFGVICFALLLMGQWCAFFSGSRPHWMALLLIPVTTRACAGLAVLLLRPMGSSQYARMADQGTRFIGALAVFLLVSIILPPLLCGSFAPLAAAAVYWLCAWHGYRQLDGMNGDISGFALTLGEWAGVLFAVLVR